MAHDSLNGFELKMAEAPCEKPSKAALKRCASLGESDLLTFFPIATISK